jgi:hypothetical protein
LEQRVIVNVDILITVSIGTKARRSLDISSFARYTTTQKREIVELDSKIATAI